MHIFPVKIIPAAADKQWEYPSLPDSSAKQLLVVSRPVAAGSQQEATLRKMMAACKLRDADYELIFFDEDSSASWAGIAAAGVAPRVLLLGVTPQELFIHSWLQPYTPQEFCGRTFIVAASLAELDRNPAAKKALWEQGLKPAFGL
jgi:hypothetical protein